MSDPLLADENVDEMLHQYSRLQCYEDHIKWLSSIQKHEGNVFFLSQFHIQDGLPLILYSLEKYVCTVTLCTEACRALSILAVQDHIRSSLLTHRTIELVSKAIFNHLYDTEFFDVACDVIVSFCSSEPLARLQFARWNVVASILNFIRVMEKVSDSGVYVKVLLAAIIALNSLTLECSQNVDAVLRQNGIEVLCNVLFSEHAALHELKKWTENTLKNLFYQKQQQFEEELLHLEEINFFDSTAEDWKVIATVVKLSEQCLRQLSKHNEETSNHTTLEALNGNCATVSLSTTTEVVTPDATYNLNVAEPVTSTTTMINPDCTYATVEVVEPADVRTSDNIELLNQTISSLRQLLAQKTEQLDHLRSKNATAEEQLSYACTSWAAEAEQLREDKDDIDYQFNTMTIEARNYKQRVLDARNAALRAVRNGNTLIPVRQVGTLNQRILLNAGFSCAQIHELDHLVRGLGQQVITDSSGRRCLSSVKREEICRTFGMKATKEIERCAIELDEYNPSGFYPVALPWNYRENRELFPSEIIEILAGMV